MAHVARYHDSAAHNPRRTSTSDGIDAASELLSILFCGIENAPNVSLADGSMLYGGSSPRASLILSDLSVLRDILIAASDVRAGEAFVRGDIRVDGDLESAIGSLEDARAVRSARELSRIVQLAIGLKGSAQSPNVKAAREPARLRGRLHSRARDRAAVEYHYNVSNEFYALWLDSDMTYSCAYFRSPSDTLDVAQQSKFDLIARKLRLAQGDRFLDIGCGWGGLIRFAAREYGARAVGITLSSRQAEYARSRIRDEGLANVCSVELVDYRDLSQLGSFDKIASVGMVEHVGAASLREYFNAAYRGLADGGLFLNHGIVSQAPEPTGLRRLVEHAIGSGLRGFVGRYVFPDGDLLRLDRAASAAANAGFETLDIENLRPHYATTLRHWVRRLENNEARARALVGDATYNTWRLYMAGSARGFAVGRMGVVQMLLAKRDARGAIKAPATRDDIYAMSASARQIG
ncbi:MAG TPA: class I SAM-dependent methyltransferase [Candidatus Eremiobacteraceae bacterium]|nr:class I SAM-dependent methyltransferase [Candidatus Eremiobacteraceae bacterium]